MNQQIYSITLTSDSGLKIQKEVRCSFPVTAIKDLMDNWFPFDHERVVKIECVLLSKSIYEDGNEVAY